MNMFKRLLILFLNSFVIENNSCQPFHNVHTSTSSNPGLYSIYNILTYIHTYINAIH